MSLQGGPKKFTFGFPSKKQKDQEPKRKADETPVETTIKKSKSDNKPFVADDEDELLASAGIGKPEQKNLSTKRLTYLRIK